MINKIALLVSSLFEIFLVLFLTWLFVVLSLPASFLTKGYWLGMVIILSGVPPFLVLVYEKQTGKISDWLVTKREQRRDFQIAWVLGALALLFFLWVQEVPQILLTVALNLFLVSLLVTVINFSWKISVHMIGTAVFVVTCILVFGVNWWWLVLLLPIVAWSRLHLRHHTLNQVLAGTLLGIVVTYFSFWLIR